MEVNFSLRNAFKSELYVNDNYEIEDEAKSNFSFPNFNSVLVVTMIRKTALNQQFQWQDNSFKKVDSLIEKHLLQKISKTLNQSLFKIEGPEIGIQFHNQLNDENIKNYHLVVPA